MQFYDYLSDVSLDYCERAKTIGSLVWPPVTSSGKHPKPSVMTGGAGDKEMGSLSQPN